MDEFLRKISDPFAHLLEAAAVYVERITPTDEDEDVDDLVGFGANKHPMWQLDERGQAVLR